MKKILFIFFLFSFLVSSNILLGPLKDTHSIEHSIGISDKLGLLGVYTQTWSYKDEYTNIESYYTIGTTALIFGGGGFGIKNSFPALYQKAKDEKYDNLTPYVSLTGHAYYILSWGSAPSKTGLAATGSVGIDVHIIKWEQINLGAQLGLISTYDFTRGNFGYTLGASNGPNWIMPSINIKVQLKKT